MRKILEIVGKKVGTQTLLSFSRKTKDNRWYFNYACDCGHLGEVEHLNFAQGKTKCHKCNCGPNHHSWKGYGEISLNVFSRIKRNALDRNLDFDLDIQYLWELFLQQGRKCSLSGVLLEFAKRDDQVSNMTASLDRISNTQGYVKGNVQWLHKAINHVKCDINLEWFISLCNLVSQNHSRNVDKGEFLNDSKDIIKTTRNKKCGAENARSKTYQIINEQNETFTITGLEHFANEKKLNVHSLRRTFKTKKFHKGWKVIANLN